MREHNADVAIIGGGLGGVAAALAAADLGASVVLTEEADWLGGQLTVQAVPPDEHPWIESTGCTPSYRRLRDGIRDYYRRNYPLLPGPRSQPDFNPGMGFVSRLCAEPRVAVAVIDELLAPHVSNGRIRALMNCRPVDADVDGDRVTAVTLEDHRNGETIVVTGEMVLDATELGDLAPLTGAEHRIGAESRDDTDELHALEGPANPRDQQAITWCFALDYREGEDHTIDEPEEYRFWREYQADFWPAPNLSWWVTEAITGRPLHRPLFAGPTDEPVVHDLWHFRRILYRKHYPEGAFDSDVTLANWAALDYWLKPLVGVDDEYAAALEGARQLSYSMLYWMQTEAPRHDDGHGYPGLRLRPDVVGTDDGLAKFPYVRESRRLVTDFTVLEQHLGVEARGDATGAEPFYDSVGIGAYRIDLHPSTALRGYVDINSWPFQIPLGALIPVRLENLLPACKNIGTTHVTNGAYRLHPVEWNIGEAVGALAAFCLDRGVPPTAVRQREDLLASFQSLLTGTRGIQLAWPEYRYLTPEQRFGSPSAIHGGRWVEEDVSGSLSTSASTTSSHD